MTLIEVADMADPFDFAALPPGISAIAGYVGGNTPHVWTDAEVAAARAHCGHWWPIWTAPERALSPVDGENAARGMLPALLHHGVTHDTPVFLDVEHDAWSANPSGALACIQAFKNVLRAAGYGKAFAYVPAEAQFDWVADWVGTPPQNLAPGVIGVQYGGHPAPNAVDFSVFDSSLLATSAPAPTPEVPDMTPEENRMLIDVWNTLVKSRRDGDFPVVVAVNAALANVQHDENEDTVELAQLKTVSDQLTAMLAKENTTGSTVDVNALATALADVLGPQLGADVVTALAVKLGG